jgi:hypothetical protein
MEALALAGANLIVEVADGTATNDGWRGVVEPKRRSCPGENTRRATASLTGVRFSQHLLLCSDARVDECELWGYRCQLRGCRSGSSQLTVSNETYCRVPNYLGVRISGCSAQDRLRVTA